MTITLNSNSAAIFGNGGYGVGEDGRFDVQSVVTDELGHVLVSLEEE